MQPFELKKKKFGLKFYPGLPLIGLRTTVPWSVIIHGHGYLSPLSPKSDKHQFSPNNRRVFFMHLVSAYQGYSRET